MELIITSIVSFATTNVDDIFVLMVLFGNGSYKEKQIIAGQLIGIGALIAISFAGSFANLFIEPAYIGLLGLLPIILGIAGIIRLNKRKPVPDEPDAPQTIKKKGNLWSVAAITFANGGDNIGIYIPLFATLSITGKIWMSVILLLMTLLWCRIGKYLSRHPLIARTLDKYGHVITPVILILLGVYILYESGSFGLTG